MPNRNILGRRKLLKKGGTIAGAGVLGLTASETVQAATNTQIDVYERHGRSLDYEIWVSDRSLSEGSNIESGDGVTTYVSSSVAQGEVNSERDTYYMSSDAVITEITVSGGVSPTDSPYYGEFEVDLTDGLESTQDRLLEIEGSHPSTEDMEYHVFPTGSVSGNGNEIDDSDNNGTEASGFVYDGGYDSYDLIGQIDRAVLYPEGGSLTVLA